MAGASRVARTAAFPVDKRHMAPSVSTVISLVVGLWLGLVAGRRAISIWLVASNGSRPRLPPAKESM